MTESSEKESGAHWLSPLKLTLLVVNAVCVGACLVLLALGKADGPLILLTVGVGLMLLAGLVGAVLASRRARRTTSDRE